jgi:hypothetical protein
VLVELMNNPKATASARALAAEKVLDRGLGKAVAIASVSMTASRRAEDLSDPPAPTR